MTKFNKKQTTSLTTNYAGGSAYQQDPKTELVSILLTSFVKDQYYRTADDTINRTIELIRALPDRIFAAKAAIYARNEFGMRSISHVVMGELALSVKNEEWMKFALRDVCKRPDDMTEIDSYVINKQSRPLPNCLKKGIALSFFNFDRYQLAKYKGEGHGVSLIDLVRLTHPLGVKKFNNRQKMHVGETTQAILDLIKGDLKDTSTYQSKKTTIGQESITKDDKVEKVKQVWIDFVNNPKVEYFALLRNLDNINSEAPEALNKALEVLVDPNRIKKSMVFPFHYQVARKILCNHPNIVAAIDDAVEISLQNVPEFSGKTLVAVDHSASMGACGVNKQVPNSEIASLFAASLFKSNDADVMVWGDTAAYVNLVKRDSLMTNVKRMLSMANHVGHGTNLESVFNLAANSNKMYDRIIIISDMQVWIGSRGNVASKALSNKPFIYSFDLGGYGTSQFPSDRIFQLAGFSDKVFDIMRLLETDKQAMVNKINEVIIQP